MAERIHDAVIVGARCAGAALATFLAREGASVVVLEAGRLGTDRVLSTHTIHPPGMDVLDELGVGAAVREKSPPARRLRFQVEDAYADVVPPEGRHECCPRRHRLDRLLQDAAAEAGAELRERTRVTGLMRDGDRVTGAEAQHGGRTVRVRARWTIGADGRHSTVARLAGAEEYLGYDWPRGGYWAYWEPPPLWGSDAYPYDFLLRMAGVHRRMIFPTDDGQLLLGTMPPLETALRIRSSPRAGYLEELRSDPVFAPLVEEGALASPVIGTVRERFFFRRSAGPGWALVGDAGHHKDPLLGWGMAEAFVQARHLAAALGDGSDAAVERYWRERDVDNLPRFRFGQDRGEPRAINPVIPTVLRHVPHVPGLPQQLFRETEYEVNPYEVMPVGKIARWTLGAAIRGRPGLILDFFRQGRRAAQVARELAPYRARLRALDARSLRGEDSPSPGRRESTAASAGGRTPSLPGDR